MPIKLPDDVRRRIRAPQAPLESARHPAAAIRRAELVEKVRAARQEIEQIFLDYAHWNDHVRKPHEERIDPDPTGDLAALRTFYDAILKHDTQ